MSIKKIKSKRLLFKHKLQSKTKTRRHPIMQRQPIIQIQATHYLTPQQPHKHQNILDIIKHYSLGKNNLRKSQNNLPAQLMKLKASTSSNLNHKQQSQRANVFTNSFSKSLSSSFSSVTKNGETHKKGKTVINNSTRPFIEIKEMDNNNIRHYMVPKNTIPYKSNLFMTQNSTISKQPTKTKKTKKSKSKKSKSKKSQK